MASTTFIDNQTTIFASWLNDVNTAVYTGVFPNGSLALTTLNVTGAVTGAGFTSLINNSLSAPGAIGSATPNTGVFTTLSATAITATSITGLTTPLSRAQGGTGLSAAGTSGYVLTSDGTNWTSALNPTIGVGQTWTDVTASRAGGTTYTNSTTKPISVLIVGTFSSGTGVVSVSVGGVLAGQSQYVSNSGWLVVCTTIVPPSSTYVATFTGSTKTSWYELR